MAFVVHRLAVLSDNYIFVLHDPDRDIAAVVDPAESEPVLNKIKELGADLVAIFNTHHHGDHVGGNRGLINAFPQVVVYGGAEDEGRIPGQQVFLHQNDRVEFGDEVGEVLFIPGHTRAHIAYYFAGTQDLFCGDTLFGAGCGRLFEGSPLQMVQSLGQLRNLPDTTRVWCAHEYTLGNLKFALTVEPDNQQLQERFAEATKLRGANIPTIPSTIGLERATNPFLRWDQAALQAVTNHQTPDRVLGRLRGMKELYAG